MMRNGSGLATKIVLTESGCICERRLRIMGVGRAVGVVLWALSMDVINIGAGRQST